MKSFLFVSSQIWRKRDNFKYNTKIVHPWNTVKWTLYNGPKYSNYVVQLPIFFVRASAVFEKKTLKIRKRANLHVGPGKAVHSFKLARKLNAYMLALITTNTMMICLCPVCMKTMDYCFLHFVYVPFLLHLCPHWVEKLME